MKIELRKEVTFEGKEFYFVYVNDWCVAAKNTLEEGEEYYNKIVAEKGMKKTEVLKSVEL